MPLTEKDITPPTPTSSALCLPALSSHVCFRVTLVFSGLGTECLHMGTQGMRAEEGDPRRAAFRPGGP